LFWGASLQGLGISPHAFSAIRDPAARLAIARAGWLGGFAD
jgi:hypothetical protein